MRKPSVEIYYEFIWHTKKRDYLLYFDSVEEINDYISKTMADFEFNFSKDGFVRLFYEDGDGAYVRTSELVGFDTYPKKRIVWN